MRHQRAGRAYRILHEIRGQYDDEQKFYLVEGQRLLYITTRRHAGDRSFVSESQQLTKFKEILDDVLLGQYAENAVEVEESFFGSRTRQVYLYFRQEQQAFRAVRDVLDLDSDYVRERDDLFAPQGRYNDPTVGDHATGALMECVGTRDSFTFDRQYIFYRSYVTAHMTETGWARIAGIDNQRNRILSQ